MQNEDWGSGGADKGGRDVPYIIRAPQRQAGWSCVRIQDVKPCLMVDTGKLPKNIDAEPSRAGGECQREARSEKRAG